MNEQTEGRGGKTDQTIGHLNKNEVTFCKKGKKTKKKKGRRSLQEKKKFETDTREKQNQSNEITLIFARDIGNIA